MPGLLVYYDVNSEAARSILDKPHSEGVLLTLVLVCMSGLTVVECLHGVLLLILS